MGAGTELELSYLKEQMNKWDIDAVLLPLQFLWWGESYIWYALGETVRSETVFDMENLRELHKCHLAI